MSKKEIIMPPVVLTVICIVAALLLAAVNMITAPIIEANQNANATAALKVVLPDGSNFKEIELTDEYPDAITKGYTADGGFVFEMKVTGKSPNLVIMCGIDLDGKVVGTKVISNSETPGYRENVFSEVEGTSGKYTGMDLDGFTPHLISGATLTSDAYATAIKAALQAAAIAKGESVDTRTPEQILQDNCNAALGTTGKTFEVWFATEIGTGVDKIYVATDESGFVFAIGEELVGVNAEGVTTAGVSEAASTSASAAYAIASTSTLTEITELPAGINAELVKKAYVTASGNYVFELEGQGYSYHYKNTIKINISIAADGAIIDCYTVKHKESKGYGDKCATEEYRNQWTGATDDDVVVTVEEPNEEEVQIGKDCTDLGAISGATFTATAYQKAVKAAFAAFEILTAQGGND